jgi:hypothetical protein
MKNTLFLSASVLLAMGTAFGQTLPTITTLNGAVDNVTTQFTLTSASAVTAGSSYIFLDRELDAVTAVSGNVVTIQRGVSGTKQAAHANNAPVVIGLPAQFSFTTPTGSCTRSNEQYLPKINVATGTVSDCLGGVWQTGAPANGITAQATVKAASPSPGGTTQGTSTASGAAGDMYCTEMFLPTTKVLTGLAPLAGATVGTDKWIVALYDSTGNLLANSAAPGSSNDGSTASVYVPIAFTGKYLAVGPADYFACVQSSGTTDTFRLVATGNADTVLTKLYTGTYATIPSTITVPTTFTTLNGPYFYAYF